MKIKVLKPAEIVVSDVMPFEDFVALDLRDKYIGVRVAGNPKKAFISRDNFEKGLFRVRCFDHITIGDGYYEASANAATVVKNVLVSGAEVFVFDSFKELANWALQEK